MEKDEKKIVGVQLSPDIYKALQDLAAQCGGTISSTIRLVVLDYLRRNTNFGRKENN